MCLCVGFFAIAAAEAESAFHTSKLLLVWLSSLAFFADFIGAYGENERIRKCTKSVANSVSGSLFGLSLCVGRMFDPATVSAFLSVTKKYVRPEFDGVSFFILAFSRTISYKRLEILERERVRVPRQRLATEAFFLWRRGRNQINQTSLLNGEFWSVPAIFGVG